MPNNFGFAIFCMCFRSCSYITLAYWYIIKFPIKNYKHKISEIEKITICYFFGVCIEICNYVFENNCYFYIFWFWGKLQQNEYLFCQKRKLWKQSNIFKSQKWIIIIGKNVFYIWNRDFNCNLDVWRNYINGRKLFARISLWSDTKII